MTNTPTNVYEVSDNKRIAIYPDYSFESPWENWDYVGIHTIRVADRMVAPEAKTEHTDNLTDIVEQGEGSHGVAEYFKARGLDYHVAYLQGYSQSEWADVIIYDLGNKENLDGYVTEAKQYWRGDVYRIVPEVLVTYTQLSNGNTISRWEEDEDEDSVGEVYLDYGTLTDEIATSLVSAEWLGHTEQMMSAN